jgi:hypothetical protein
MAYSHREILRFNEMIELLIDEAFHVLSEFS